MDGLSEARECGRVKALSIQSSLSMRFLSMSDDRQTDSSGVLLRKKTGNMHDSRLPFHLQGLPHLHSAKVAV
jgi:hypothetical protein